MLSLIPFIISTAIWNNETSDIPGSQSQLSQAESEIRILFCGEYHHEELDSTDLIASWYGLFQINGKYSIRKTNVKFSNVYDAIFDDDGEMSGWKIQIDGGVNCIMLVTGLQGIASKQVATVAFQRNSYPPGSEESFELNGVTYSLGGEGTAYTGTDNWNDIRDYKLNLTCYISGKENVQCLVAKEAFEDSQVSVIWCGDLDKDQKPDFLINTTHHYNVSAPTLYLSSLSTPENLVKEAAKRVRTGC